MSRRRNFSRSLDTNATRAVLRAHGYLDEPDRLEPAETAIPWWFAEAMPEPWSWWLWEQWRQAWAELTESVCGQVWSKVGSRWYAAHRDKQLRQDLQSWLRLQACEAAARFTPDPWHPQPHLQWAAYLSRSLHNVAPRHFREQVGNTATEYGKIKIAAYNTRESLEHLDEIETDTGYRPERHPLHGRSIEYADPVKVLIRLETTETIVRDLERDNRRAGTYTSASGVCYENLCTRPAVAAGLCQVHRNAQNRTAGADAPGGPCNVPGCINGHRSRGLCHAHYARYRAGTLTDDELQYVEHERRPARKPTTEPCSVDGCDRTGNNVGMCQTHRAKHLLANAPPCTIDGCENPQKVRQLCGAHYAQWLLLNAPPCSEPECDKPTKTAGLCGMHYQRMLRARHTGEREAP